MASSNTMEGRMHSVAAWLWGAYAAFRLLGGLASHLPLLLSGPPEARMQSVSEGLYVAASLVMGYALLRVFASMICLMTEVPDSTTGQQKQQPEDRANLA